jgi:ATP-dependent Clp protease ATP-binding subunit ClpC
VRRQPFSVVLFDEVEKAHPAVFDVLLGVLGEGRLTDATGGFVDFRSTVVIMTSNLGAETARPRAGFGAGAGPADLIAHYRAEAQRFFRPELFNRLDDLVVFSALGGAHLRSIADRELAQVIAREGFRRREVQLQISEEVRAHLTERGSDPRFGARPLKRVIERELVAPVAAYLADHPAKGALGLEALHVDGALKLAATSLGGDQEGVARKGIEDVLHQAAALRAEVRRWTSSAAMRRLQEELRLFERSSRQPAFWLDRSLADEHARAAAEARELQTAFSTAQRSAEAAEDLAYEAYYARQVAAAASLRGDLGQVRRELTPLTERLFASLFPPRTTVGLLLTTSASGWKYLCGLRHSITRWTEARGGTLACYQLKVTKPAATARGETKSAPAKAKRPKKRDAQASDAATPGRAAPRADGCSFRWVSGPPDPQQPGDLFTVLLLASAARGLMLLSGEHGAHRFTDGGNTAVVQVRFDARLGAPPLDADFLTTLHATQPAGEVRRIWPAKGEVYDDRLKRRFPLVDQQVALEPILAAWLRLRILRDGATSGEAP